MENYYEILEIHTNSDLETIKKSYRKLALKYHPDRNIKNKTESEIKFKKISEAYQVLSCPEKKIIYDSFRLYKGSTCDFKLNNPDNVFKEFFKEIPEEYLKESHRIFNMFNKFEHKDFSLNLLQKLHKNPYLADLLKDIIEKIPEEFKSLFSILVNNTNKFHNNKQKKKEYYKPPISESIVKIKNRPDRINTTCNQKKNDIYINVNISLEDIYNKVEKEVKVKRIRKKNNWFQEEEISLTFPAHFQPALKFKNEGNQFNDNSEAGDIIININSKPHKIYKRKDDYNLLVERYISIYEIYNGTQFTIKYLNNQFLSIRSKSCIYKNMYQKIPLLGLPIPDSNGKQGNLYINFKIQFPNLKEKEKEEHLYKLFPPINNGIPDSFFMEPYKEVLLEANEN